MKYFLTLFTWFLLGGLLNNLMGCEKEGADTTAPVSPQLTSAVFDPPAARRQALFGNLQEGPNDENF